MKSKLDQMLPAGVALTVDFNPGADRMRVVGADGINLRITGDDDEAIVFNIKADGKGGNTGWLLADGTLSMIDIGNGQLRTSGQVSGLKGAVRDIAVLPAIRGGPPLRVRSGGPCRSSWLAIHGVEPVQFVTIHQRFSNKGQAIVIGTNMGRCHVERPRTDLARPPPLRAWAKARRPCQDRRRHPRGAAGRDRRQAGGQHCRCELCQHPGGRTRPARLQRDRAHAAGGARRRCSAHPRPGAAGCCNVCSRRRARDRAPARCDFRCDRVAPDRTCACAPASARASAAAAHLPRGGSGPLPCHAGAAGRSARAPGGLLVQPFRGVGEQGQPGPHFCRPAGARGDPPPCAWPFR